MSYEQYPSKSHVVLTKVIVLATAIAAIAAVAYYLVKDDAKTTELRDLPKSTTIAPVTTSAEPVKATVEKPVYEEPKAVPQLEPLPDLNQSDAVVIASLQGLNIDGLLQLVTPEEVLRKFVRAVDAVEEGKIITEYRPITSPQGVLIVDSYKVAVAGGELGSAENVEQFQISTKNYQRYDLYVNVLSSVNPDTLATIYKRFYPLLNAAYKEMGLTKGNFHSVLIRAIDHLLASPDVSGGMTLIQPKVYFEFADPALEKLPATYKLMLRMGPVHVKKIKESLRGLRSRLV